MTIYMLEAEGEDLVRVDTSDRRETLVKGSGGHAWKDVNGNIKEED